MTEENFARDQTYASALEALTCASVMPDGKGSHAGFKHAIHEAFTQHPLVLLLAVRSVTFRGCRFTGRTWGGLWKTCSCPSTGLSANPPSISAGVWWWHSTYPNRRFLKGLAKPHSFTLEFLSPLEFSIALRRLVSKIPMRYHVSVGVTGLLEVKLAIPSIWDQCLSLFDIQYITRFSQTDFLDAPLHWCPILTYSLLWSKVFLNLFHTSDC